MNKFKVVTISIILILLFSFAAQSIDAAARPLGATTPPLGTAGNFSLLATTAITDGPPNPPASDVAGDAGISPAAGIPVTMTIGGAPHDNDGVAAQAVLDAQAAALDMASQAATASLGPGLNGVTVTPGVYDVGAGLLSGGVLTLNGPGVYIFRASSTLISSGTINLINGARPCDVFWRVETAATINGSSFAGTIIANTGVHFGSGVTLDGRALAVNGDVTLINDHIVGPSCPAPAEIVNTKRIKLTQQASSVSGLPNTGGAPIRNPDFSWMLALAAGGLSLLVLGLGLRAYRRANRSH